MAFPFDIMKGYVFRYFGMQVGIQLNVVFKLFFHNDMSVVMLRNDSSELPAYTGFRALSRVTRVTA